MADLETRTFDQLVEQQATAVQAAASGLVDYSTGSIPLAVGEAFAAVVLWLQALILQLLTVTRAATSSDTDLDSWMADFGQARLAAVAAEGAVSFGRYTATSQASIAVGTLVQTSDGSVQYQVIADTAQSAYSASASAYIIPAGTTSISATVQATAVGTVGNATAGAINTLAQSISGVDYVTNATAFDNGADAESDPAFRTRFIAYLASLYKATKAAIGYAVTSLQQGLTYAITEWQAYDGTTKLGYFYVVVDDGTGSPSSGTLDAVTTSIDAARACGIQFSVFAPSTVVANVSAIIGVADGYADGPLQTAVQTAVSSYISTLKMGENLLWSRLITVIYGASDGVSSVTDLLVNGATSDIVATGQQVITPGTVSISS